MRSSHLIATELPRSFGMRLFQSIFKIDRDRIISLETACVVYRY